MCYEIFFNKNRNQFIAFTLAEVLIVLVIIGIVAALTIPALIQSVQKDQYVTKLKKEYSVISQAFNELAQDAGGSITDVPNFSSTTDDNSEDVATMNSFATKLNISKNCGSGLGCLPTAPLRWMGSGQWASNEDSGREGNYAKAILADGTMMLIDIYNFQCNYSSGLGPLHASTCGEMEIDINGAAGPNQFGRDFFSFWITKTGIYPKGLYSDGNICDVTGSGWGANEGCTAKVIQEGAMNY